MFVRLVGQGKDVARARLRDGATMSLRETPERDEDWPYWSEAAGRLLLQVRPAGATGGSTLVLWDPATTTERPLGATPGREDHWPMWSPDGRSVVFAFLGKAPASGVGVVDVATGRLHVIGTAGPQDWFFRPHFAPDGQAIVAQKRWGDTPGASLWILHAAHPPRPLRDDRERFYQKPWFTRDGRDVVYSVRPAAGGLRNVEIIDAAGMGPPRVVVDAPGADDHSAIPSPTRDEIAFISNRDGSMDLFVVDLAGGVPQNLTRTPRVDEYAPHWSPDGARIVITAEPARQRPLGAGDDVALSKATIVVLDRDGKRLFETPGFMPDWMPPWP